MSRILNTLLIREEKTSHIIIYESLGIIFHKVKYSVKDFLVCLLSCAQ